MAMNPRIPNLFILGAPKCGTTSLSHYLAGHPDIFMSEQAGNKEPEYFASDFRFGGMAVTSRAAYLDLFAAAPSSARYLGEASVSYLHSRVATARILAESPEARLLVMIRNPVDIARSLHNQQVKDGLERVLDFEKAWRLQDARYVDPQAEAIGSPHPYAFQLREFARIGTQLQRLYDTARKQQILVIDYDHFAADTHASYRAVLDFLGLEDDGRTRFERSNQAVHYRFSSVQKALTMTDSLRARLHIPGGWGVRRFVENMDFLRRRGPSMRPPFRAELQEYFRPEVERVSQVLGRDYSHWSN